jgi:hypothetical protein
MSDEVAKDILLYGYCTFCSPTPRFVLYGLCLSGFIIDVSRFHLLSFTIDIE